MNKIILILCLIIGVAFATQSYSNRYDGAGEVLKMGSKTLVIVDTVRDNDTMWCTELNITSNAGEWYSIGFDIDAINSTVAGEIIMRQGNESGNLQFYTSLYTLSEAVDTTINISNSVDPYTFLQLGITNTDNSDSLNPDFLNITKTQ